MAEYIEIEAIKEQLRELQGNYLRAGERDKFLGAHEAFRAVCALQTIDAVEIVRCKDCIYSRERNSYEEEYLVEGVVICTNNDVHDDAWGAMYGDDFCSYGERKDGDEND